MTPFAPDIPVLYKGQPAQTRHSFCTDICPSGVLVEVWRHGPLDHYVGFVCSSRLILL